jgi:hypothetical protein
MQCNAMQCNAMAMQCNAMQCNAMQCNVKIISNISGCSGWIWLVVTRPNFEAATRQQVSQKSPRLPSKFVIHNAQWFETGHN